MKNTVNMLTVILLATGAAFGMAGTFVAQRNLQAAAWAIDGVALVVATALMALRFFRAGSDFAAAGFLVFSIGESVMLVGTATSITESTPSFAAGTALPWTRMLDLATRWLLAPHLLHPYPYAFLPLFIRDQNRMR